MATALVTGSTSGLGAAFAHWLAAHGYDVVLVARDVDRLATQADELSTKFGGRTEVIAADLASPHELAKVEQRLKNNDDPIDLLVNNAGFSVSQKFVGGDLEKEEYLLNVLVRAVLRTTHAALPGMVERHQGAVINVSSMSAYIPGGTYAAAKAWVEQFTQGLAPQLNGTGVRALTLSAGYIHTEFHQRAGMDVSKIPEALWLKADEVVAEAMRDLERGRVVSTPGTVYKVLSPLLRATPRAVRRALGARRPGANPR